MTTFKQQVLSKLAQKRQLTRCDGYLCIADLHGGAYECDHISPGETVNYQVKTIEVVDLIITSINTEQLSSVLVLVNCYLFDVVFAGGSLRYVVTAVNLIKHNN